ncbi:MAG: pitrilysin family protein [Chloroflexi bacterium]|nr:pitrilysin family protein [Chloroflexota bacterium]
MSVAPASPVDSYEMTTLDNGLRVVSVTLPHTMAISFSIYFATGSRYESDASAGISHYLEHMLFKGTRSWPSAREISEAVEGVGGHLNAATGQEIVHYWARVPAPKLELAADVVCSLIRDPILDAGEFEKERKVILEELDMTRDDPHSRISMLAEEVTFPGHPLGRDIGGRRESLESLTREDLVRHLSREYVPRAGVACVAGRMSHGEAVAVVDKFLGGWGLGRSTQSRNVTKGLAFGNTVLNEHRDIEQANLCLTMPGISYEDSDRWTLALVNGILGSGMSSRLFQRIREELALAYAVQSFSQSYSDQGLFGVYAGVSPRSATSAVDAVLTELRRFAETVTPDELNRAREYLKGRLVLGMEDTRGVVSWLGRQEALVGRIVTVAEVLESIEATTLDDVRRVADRIFDSSNYKLAVLGPFESEKQFEAQLAAA